MQRSKYFLTLFFVTVILTLVADNHVTAAPEPCMELMKLMRQKRKPTTTPQPPKNPKKEKIKLFEKFMENLNPQWIVHIDEATTQPTTAPTTQPSTPNVLDTYMAMFGYLFSVM